MRVQFLRGNAIAVAAAVVAPRLAVSSSAAAEAPAGTSTEGVADLTGLSVGVGYAFNETYDVALNWTRLNGDIEVPASGNRARFAVSQDIDMVGLLAEFRF